MQTQERSGRRSHPKQIKGNPAEDMPRMESSLKSQTETTKAKAIESKTETKRLRTTHFGPHDKQELD